MAKPAPSRVAAALDYLERLKNQAAEFGGGVVENLADRARSVGGLAYEALTTDPNIGRMTTAEFSQAAADRAPTPRLEQTARDIGTIGRAIVTQPIQTGKAIVRGEVERAREAMTSPRAAGEYAGSFIDPMRIAAALRKTAPVLELDVYHGTPHRFPATEANPLGEFDASKIGTGEGAQAYGYGIYLAENPSVATGYRKAMQGRTYENIQSNEILDSDDLFKTARESVRKNTGLEEFPANYVTSKVLAWIDEGNDVNDFLKKNVVSDELKPAFETAIQFFQNTRPGSSFYKADLPDEMIDRMLDWDKPLSKQSAAVQAALLKLEPDAILSDKGSNVYLRVRSRMTGPYKQAAAQASQVFSQAGIPGIKYLDAGSLGQGGSGTRNFVVFPGEEKKVKILERNGQPAPERIARALEAAPSAFEQRLREQYGDFAQAYNLGLPDTPEYRRIVQEVTAQGPLSDDALREAIGAHPAYVRAGGKAAATELRQSKRGGAAALVDSLSEQGVKARVETSKSLGSRSTYIYASKGGKTVKIRLSDHLPAESGRVYGTNDIMTTPQHWKSAAKRALELLEEAD